MNNPSLGRPYRFEVDAALEALEAENERQESLATAVRLGHIRGPFVVRNRPVMRITRQMALVLLGCALIAGLTIVWLAEEISKHVGPQ
jgi:hypothetical protein